MYIGNVVAEKIQFETHHVNLFFALSFFPKCAGNMGIFPWHVSAIKRVKARPMLKERFGNEFVQCRTDFIYKN